MKVLNITYNKVVTVISNDVEAVNGKLVETNNKVYTIRKKSDFFNFIQGEECFNIKVSCNLKRLVSKIESFGFECNVTNEIFGRTDLFCTK